VRIELNDDQVQRVLQDLALVDRQGVRAAADKPCSAEALWTVTDRIRTTLGEGNPTGEFVRAREAHENVQRQAAFRKLEAKGVTGPAVRAGCGCACNSGGFCGGCGHAGCGRR
jgi:hypothetical protein